MAVNNSQLDIDKKTWNNLDYSQQQSLLKSNSKLQGALNSLGLTVKSAPNTNTTVNNTPVNNTSTTNTSTTSNGNTNTTNSTTSTTGSTGTTGTTGGTNNAAWYNQVKPKQVNDRTKASNATVDNLGYQWDKLTYEQQQQKFNQTPALRTAVEKLGLRIKGPNDITPTRTTETATTGTTGPSDVTGKTGTDKTDNTFVPGSEWDYQDNSQARMDQIANNLSKYRVTNPELFENRDDFYNFFIKDKGRSQDQIDYLWSYYDNVQKYGKYDTLTPNEIGAGLVDGTIPQDYLNWLKATDPAKYTGVGEAMKNKQDEITNESYLNTIMEEAGLGNQIGNEYSDMTKWAIKNGLLVDKNGDWTDDGLYVEASDEEKQLWKADSEYEAEKLKLTNAMKDLQSDLTDQYPDADLSTIMLLTADRGQKIQKALDTIAVSQTRTQGEIKYLQNERDMQSKARQQTISNLQKAYGMYYDYSPEGISELAQAQYAATNVTLDQAENGTDTQKQMALQNVLDGYYSKYGDIIERSEGQVINDVMALAKEKGISLNDALEENFLQHLRAKPGFKQLNTVSSNNPDVTRIGTDSEGNPVYGYWKDGQLISIDGITGTGVGGMRTERNNNPTAMTTDVARSLGGVEGVDYEVGDSWTNSEGKTYYTAKLLGDPIETTIRLLDRAASSGRGAFYTSGGKQRWSHTAMSDADWLKLSDEEKQGVVLKMLKNEGGDISKMAGYNQPKVNGLGYNPDLSTLFDEYNAVGDDQLNKKRFREGESGKTLKSKGITQEEFLKQYKEYYAATTKDAFLDLLKNIDLLIEETGEDLSPDERTLAISGIGNVGNSYALLKNNATVQGLADAKAKGLKLGVLSDSDVRMIANASSSMSPTNSAEKWRRDLKDFREKILSKNKYLAEEYGIKSAYSNNTYFKYNNKTGKYVIKKGTPKTTGTAGSNGTGTKNIKNMGQ